MADILVGLLGGLGSIIGSAVSGAQNPYQKIDFRNYNPYTSGVFNQVNSAYGNLNNLFNESLARAGQAQGLAGSQARDLLNQATSLNTIGYDPEAAMNAFIARAPQLQSLARSSLGNDAQGELNAIRAQTGRDAAARFGGSPTSSAYRREVTSALAEPSFQYATNRDNLLSGLTGQMLNNAMGNIGSQYQTAAQLNNARISNLLNLAGQQLNIGNQGQQQLSLLAQLLSGAQNNLVDMGRPQYMAPNYMSNPAYMTPGESITGMVGGLELLGEGLKQADLLK